MLTQEGRPLAFTNKELAEKNRVMLTYEKDMLAILHDVIMVLMSCGEC